jgi:hypothetical protein
VSSCLALRELHLNMPERFLIASTRGMQGVETATKRPS